MFNLINRPLKLTYYSPVALSLVILGLAGCDKNTTEAPLPRLVKVTAFKHSEHTTSSSYPGRLIARYESKLAFQVGGRLVERLVDVGTQVSKGQTIAVLDSKDYDLVSENLFSQKRAATADYQRAKNDLQRAKQLRADNFIGEAELDRAVNLEATAKANLEALKAQHSKSLNERDYTQLHGPADGIITSITAEVGDVLNPSHQIAVLAWDKHREFITALPEEKINSLNPGQSVSVEFWAVPNLTFEAHVREISPIVDPGSQTYSVKLSLQDPTNALKLGMSGYAIFAQSSGNVGLLPTSSLLVFEEQVQVIVVEADTGLTRAQAVTLGASVGDQSNITGGLKNNDLVVVAGANKIKPGDTVRILHDTP